MRYALDRTLELRLELTAEELLDYISTGTHLDGLIGPNTYDLYDLRAHGWHLEAPIVGPHEGRYIIVLRRHELIDRRPDRDRHSEELVDHFALAGDDEDRERPADDGGETDVG